MLALVTMQENTSQVGIPSLASLAFQSQRSKRLRRQPRHAPSQAMSLICMKLSTPGQLEHSKDQETFAEPNLFVRNQGWAGKLQFNSQELWFWTCICCRFHILAGGFCLLWRGQLEVTILDSNQYLIHASICHPVFPCKWLPSCVHALPQPYAASKEKKLWSSLKSVASTISDP